MTPHLPLRPMLVLLLAGLGLGNAVPPARADSAFTPAPLFSAQQISFKTLPNGVRAIAKSAPGNDMVSIQVWVKAGSRYESASESGLAHLVEVAALRASNLNPNRTGNGGPSEALSALGGTSGSLTARDSTFYSALVATPYAESAMRILSDAVLRPDLSAAGLEDCKIQIQDELTRRNLDGVNLASDLAYAVGFDKHPYRKPAAGTLIGISGLGSAKARAFYKRQYVGANMTVVVVGEISNQKAQDLVTKYFSAAPSTKPVEPSIPAEGALKMKVMSRPARVAREALVLGWRSPAIRNAKDVVAMDTLLSLWREGLDANLRRILMRDGEDGPNKPLVGSFDVDFLTQKDSGLFLISMTDVQDKEAAVNAVLDEVKRVSENGVTPEELTRAKTLLRRQYVSQGDNPAGQAGALGFYDMISDYKFAVDYLTHCAGVTSDDLKRVAKTYISPTTYIRAEINAIPLPKPDSGDDSPNVITTSLEVTR